MAKKDVVGRIICPKCKKSDKTMPIIYSFENKIGVTPEGYYASTDVVKPARYYCDRDKIKF